MTAGRLWEPGQERRSFGGHLISEGEDDGGLLAQLRPAEGWVSIPLVLILCAVMAWSISDARWILGRDELTSFLIWAAILGGLWGWFSSRLSIQRWYAHLLGALIAAFTLSIIVGYVIDPEVSDPFAAFDATARSVAQAYIDLAIDKLLTTTQVGHFCLILGVLVWGTAQAAAYDVFGHRKAVNGVLLLAVVLVANMALTFHDQYAALVVFTAAALLLLLRAHAADERSTWIRHRIWRARESESPHLRGGMTFASIAVVASLLLTSVASSAPLADAWKNLPDSLRDLATSIERYLPAGGQTRIPPLSGDFSGLARIGSSWTSNNDPVFEVRVPDREPHHWRMVVYDKYEQDTWGFSATKTEQLAPSDEILVGTGDDVDPKDAKRSTVEFEVTVVDNSVKHLISPADPVKLDQKSSVSLVADSDGVTHFTEAFTDSKSYVVTANIPNIIGVGTGGLTANELRAAGTAYPPGVVQMYVNQGRGSVGDLGRALLQTILDTPYSGNHALDNPYDIAKAIENYLSSADNFTYNADITDIKNRECSGLGWVDCFAKIKTGFCQQYATTMTMLLRLEGIPARYVQGYLPGSLDQFSPIRRVTRAQAHAWVEAYFPGYGWIEFDPTGGGRGVPTIVPPGPKVSPKPSASAAPSASARRSPVRRFNESDRPNGSAGGPTDGGSGGWPLLPPVVLGGAAGLGLLALLWYRRPLGTQSPDAVYAGVVRWASLLGYRPQPTQTVYEYVGSLERAVPSAKPQLELVAAAKVETAYGRRQLGVDRLHALSRAGRQLRLALMRLAVKRRNFLRRRRRRR